MTPPAGAKFLSRLVTLLHSSRCVEVEHREFMEMICVLLSIEITQALPNCVPLLTLAMLIQDGRSITTGRYCTSMGTAVQSRQDSWA
jgi:hypothetical protein